MLDKQFSESNRLTKTCSCCILTTNKLDSHYFVYLLLKSREALSQKDMKKEVAPSLKISWSCVTYMDPTVLRVQPRNKTCSCSHKRNLILIVLFVFQVERRSLTEGHERRGEDKEDNNKMPLLNLDLNLI